MLTRTPQHVMDADKGLAPRRRLLSFYFHVLLLSLILNTPFISILTPCSRMPVETQVEKSRRLKSTRCRSNALTA